MSDETMRYSLTSLVRLTVIVLVGSSAAAVGVSRITPKPTTWRMPSPIEHVMVNAFFLEPSFRGSYALQRDRCEMRPVEFDSGVILDHASCSPWRDDRGEGQVAGRWSLDPGGSDEQLVGLARVSFPGGVLLDRVATEIVPVSSPTWYPGTRARILFSAGDGALYDYAFERPGAEPTSGEHDEAPTRIAWACTPPGLGDVSMNDPHWPTDPSFGHVAFVTLRRIEPDLKSQRYTKSKVWWLRLGDEGRTIEAAGPVMGPAEGNADLEERCPVVVRGPDGGLVLSFFRKEEKRNWSLWAVPIGFRATDRRIPVASGSERLLAEGCLPCPPIFSTDGRWVNAIQVDDSGRKVVRRFDAEGPLRLSVSNAPPPGSAAQ